MAGRFTIEAVFKGIDKVTKPIRRMQASMQKFTRRTTRNLKTVNNQINKIGVGIKKFAKRALIGFGVVTGAVALVMREFSKFEDAAASFEPILGSAEKAKKLVREIGEIAAKGVSFDALSRAADVLLAMGAAGEDTVIPMLKMFGDLTKGNAETMNRMAINFAEIAGNGRAMTKDLRQFASAGIPIMAEFEKITGKSREQLNDMATRGKIGFDLVSQALQNMTKKGGFAFGALDKASQTFSGRLRAMRFRISLTAAAIGEQLAPELKKGADEISKIAGEVLVWVRANKELIGEKFKEMVQKVKDFFIFLKDNGPILISLATWTLGFVATIKALTLAMTAVTVATALATGVMKGFGFLALLNPMVLGATALAVAVGLIALKWDDTFEAMKRVANLSKKEDEEKAALTRAQAVGPSANIFANLTDEEKARMSDQDRAIFGLPPKSESTASATVTIRDDTGRAEVTHRSQSGPDAAIALDLSGDF